MYAVVPEAHYTWADFSGTAGRGTRGCKHTHFGQGLEQEIDEVQQHMQLL